jgi:ribosomal protein L24E
MNTTICRLCNKKYSTGIGVFKVTPTGSMYYYCSKSCIKKWIIK